MKAESEKSFLSFQSQVQLRRGKSKVNPYAY